MENQHRHIHGYRELDADEIALMNEIKEAGWRMGALVKKVQERLVVASPDENRDWAQAQRWAALARTDLQVGIMKLIRAVAQPDDGF